MVAGDEEPCNLRDLGSVEKWDKRTFWSSEHTNVKSCILDGATLCSETWPDSPEISSAQHVPVATLDMNQQHTLAATKPNHGTRCTTGMSNEALNTLLLHTHSEIWILCPQCKRNANKLENLGEGYLDAWRLVHMKYRDRNNQVCLAQEAEGKTQAAVPS